VVNSLAANLVVLKGKGSPVRPGKGGLGTVEKEFVYPWGTLAGRVLRGFRVLR